MSFLPAMYALDEDGPWLAEHPREVSEFTWAPGVPAVLDVTDPQFPLRRVLLDVDTLQVVRVDRLELDGKAQLGYDRDRVRQHLERLVAENRTMRRGRYNTKATARALRLLAAGGAKSSWPIGERLDPEHPLEDRHWIRPAARETKRPAAPVLRWPPKAERTAEPPPSRSAPAPAAKRGETDYDRVLERTLNAWPQFKEILS